MPDTLRNTSTLRDTSIDVKIVLSALWTAMLFLFAYVDIFGFYRADVVEGVLAGEVAGQDITINQAFLAGATGYIIIPSLMIVASLLLPAVINRRLNIGVSIFYAVSIAALCIGEDWAYYLLGSGFEVALLAVAARTAWTWPVDEAV